MTVAASVYKKLEECLLGLDLVNNWCTREGGPRAEPNNRVLCEGWHERSTWRIKTKNLSGILGFHLGDRTNCLLHTVRAQKSLRMLLFKVVVKC